MAEASDVVRTRRVEIIDGQGRVRVVIGRLGEGEEPIFGLTIKNQKGRDRVWMLHEGRAAEVGLDSGGNTVAALSVSDVGTPELYLSD